MACDNVLVYFVRAYISFCQYLTIPLFFSRWLCVRLKSIKIIIIVIETSLAIPFPLSPPFRPLISSALFRKVSAFIQCRFSEWAHTHSQQFAHLHLTNEINWTNPNEFKRYTNTCAHTKRGIRTHIHLVHVNEWKTQTNPIQTNQIITIYRWFVRSFIRSLVQFMCARSFNMLILLSFVDCWENCYYLMLFLCIPA